MIIPPACLLDPTVPESRAARRSSLPETSSKWQFLTRAAWFYRFSTIRKHASSSTVRFDFQQYKTKRTP
jgi:hypothetical protein